MKDKLSVIILNYNRPVNIKKYIIPSLEKYDLVDEIIISHGKKETSFNENLGKVKNLQHWIKENEEYGLARRFLSALESKNERVIIMDDDIIPTYSCIKSLNDKMDKEINTYGIYGRKVDISGKYIKGNFFGKVPIVLTRCLITTKTMCSYFMANFRTYESNNVINSKPYWNGEDILFSLLSIKKYKKLPESYQLSHSNFISDYFNFKGISFDKEHDIYRKNISQEFIGRLDIKNKIIEETSIENNSNEIIYFIRNSILIYPIVLFLIFILFFSIYRIKNKFKIHI